MARSTAEQQHPAGNGVANGTSKTSTSNSPHLSKNAIEAEAQRHASSTAPATAWDTPGPASYDFRSDTITTPTASMLKSIASTTLLDDVFLEDPTTNNLQSFICDLTGHEASLLVTSGTQGNQLALRCHLNSAPPHGVVLDARSHIYGWEAGGAAWMSGALVRPTHPGNGKYLTLEDVQKATTISDDIHATNTKLVCLENTLAGTLFPLEEMRKISQWTREHNIPLHCDGARLWEAVAADVAESHPLASTPSADLRNALIARFQQYTACFDSISLCFSKGLGAPIGSALSGSSGLIKCARQARKAMGSGMRQAGIIAAPARVAVEETFLSGRLAASHERAREVAAIWQDVAHGALQADKSVETNMVWCDLASVGTDVESFVRLCREEGLRVMGGRLVVHYQISEDAVERWRRVCQTLGSRSQKHGNDDVDREGPAAKKMMLNVE
ncbi:MAG: hypothetical protein Q9162_002866 [Coniocarpon cinnabarinum]